jgi:hypothetical protein
MRIWDMLPEVARAEMEAIEDEIRKKLDPLFDSRRDPWCALMLIAVWCVREIVKGREAT